MGMKMGMGMEIEDGGRAGADDVSVFGVFDVGWTYVLGWQMSMFSNLKCRRRRALCLARCRCLLEKDME